MRYAVLLAPVMMAVLPPCGLGANRGARARKPISAPSENVAISPPATSTEADRLIFEALAEIQVGLGDRAGAPNGASAIPSNAMSQLALLRATHSALAAAAGSGTARASSEPTLSLLGEAAKLARRLKQVRLELTAHSVRAAQFLSQISLSVVCLLQHKEALSYHQEMLSLRGQLGAIPETFLVLWTEIATDQQLDGQFAAALSTLAQAEEHLAGALSDEAKSLVGKQRAFLHDCTGNYSAAAASMAAARSIAEADDP